VWALYRTHEGLYSIGGTVRPGRISKTSMPRRAVPARTAAGCAVRASAWHTQNIIIIIFRSYVQSHGRGGAGGVLPTSYFLYRLRTARARCTLCTLPCR
jgi:hypothetical protein